MKTANKADKTTQMQNLGLAIPKKIKNRHTAALGLETTKTINNVYENKRKQTLCATCTLLKPGGQCPGAFC